MKKNKVKLPQRSKVTNRVRLPRLLILVGLPGSGKSYFSKHLSATDDRIVVISQDEMGSRSKCEEEFAKAIKKKDTKSIIVDKCNVTKQDRKNWIQMSMLNKKDIGVVYFDYPFDECVKRVKCRVDHPTIKFGRGENIVKSFFKRMVMPDTNEGFIKMVTIKSFEECNNVLIKLGCDKSGLSNNEHNIIKFPRTHHIFDAGGTGVSRDDLLLNDEEIEEYLGCQLHLEEKVDGANLGISITEDWKIVFQNRSHYVTYETSSQFKGLKAWQDAHCGDLFMILEPNRHILYGEWCYAKHSIHYTELPNYFLAFDIFDKVKNKFYSREKFYQVMNRTGIPVVPLVAKVKFGNKNELHDELMRMLDTQSKFRDGFVEGIYIRKDNEDYLEKRCKLVRPDFVQGIEKHWSKQELVKNVVKY